MFKMPRDLKNSELKRNIFKGNFKGEENTRSLSGQWERTFLHTTLM